MNGDEEAARGADPAAGRPALRVVRGEPTAEELAALTVVLQAVSAASDSAAASQTGDRPRSQWSAPGGRLRTPFPHGPGAWRASGLPR